MSTRHREALAHLMYGIKSDGGFILLTGEVGTGKTTVCRCLLAQMPADVDVALVLNPNLTAVEMLMTMCDELTIGYPEAPSVKSLVDRLNTFLLASHEQGRKTIVIIDEAQNLDVEVLEQLRLLTNLETNERKLLQIMLLGQPELLTLLARQELRQLSQRVTARFHLHALNRFEVSEYIRHRLDVAGSSASLFSASSIRLIYQLSGGIPRLVNLICDRALLGAYVESRSVVSRRIVKQAAGEVLGTTANSPGQEQWRQLFRFSGLLALTLAATVAFVLIWSMPEGWPDMGKAANNSATSSTLQRLLPLRSGSATAEPAPELTMTPPTQPLSELQGHGQSDSALVDLLAIWKTDTPATTGLYPGEAQPNAESICAQSLTYGLQCLLTNTSLADIAQLNRPVVVNIGTSTLPNWLTLVALDYPTSRLRIGAREFTVDTDELAAFWQPQNIIFWRLPPAYQGNLKLGDSGASVDWLVNRLNMVETGEPLLDMGFMFDINLEKRLKLYQASHGLEPSGVADTRTWISLNNADDAGIPLLNTSANAHPGAQPGTRH